MNIREIEAFDAFMSLGTVTKAAQKMNISQPMVSRLLSQIEHDAGFKLFERKRNLLEATKDAHIFHNVISRSLIALREIKTTADAISNKQFGRIIVAAQPIYASSFMLDIIAEFKKKRPDVGVKIIELGLENLLKTITEHECDIGIGINLDVRSYRAEMLPLGRCEAKCLIPANHPLAKKKIIELNDFIDTATVELSLGSPLRTRVDYMMQTKGIQRNITAEANTLLAVHGLVRRGVGIAIVDPLTALLDSGNTLVYRPLDFPIIWDMAIFYRGDKSLSSIEQDFVKITEQEIDKLKKRKVLK